MIPGQDTSQHARRRAVIATAPTRVQRKQLPNSAHIPYPGAVEGLRGGALEVLPADVRSGHRGTLLDTVLVELHLGRAGRSHTCQQSRKDQLPLSPCRNPVLPGPRAQKCPRRAAALTGCLHHRLCPQRLQAARKGLATVASQDVTSYETLLLCLPPVQATDRPSLRCPLRHVAEQAASHRGAANASYATGPHRHRSRSRQRKLTLGGAREDRGGGECRRRSGGGGERDRPEHFCYKGSPPRNSSETRFFPLFSLREIQPQDWVAELNAVPSSRHQTQQACRTRSAWARAPAPRGNSRAVRGLKTVPWAGSQQWKGAPSGRAGAPACAPDGKGARLRIPHAAKDTVPRCPGTRSGVPL